MLCIDELIQKLIEIRNANGSLETCKIGHYGEVCPMSIADVYVEKARRGMFGDGEEITVVNIDAPDIGPEPD